MTERTRNFAVGVTGLLGVGGLMLLSFVFGYIPEMLVRGYPVTVELATTGGLTLDSRVQLNGIDIGHIKEIKLREDASGVVMTALIRPQYQVPADAEATVNAPLLGGSAVLLFEHQGVAQSYIPNDGTARITADTSSMVDRMAKQIRSAIAGPAANFEQLSGQLDGLITEWQAVGKNIKTLTAPLTTDAVDQGDAAGNLATIFARADERLRSVRDVVSKAQAWLGDEQLRTDVKQTVASARSTAEKADKVMGKVDGEVEQLSEESVKLIRRYVAVADNASKTISTMQQLLSKANEGEGTAGRILNDPSLYENLDDSAKRVGDALDEMQLLIEKLKAEGVQIKL